MMWQLYTFLTVATALLACLTSQANGQQEVGTVTYNNRNRLLFDVDGNQIDASAAKIYFFENKFFLYGASFSANQGGGGLNCYSSTDLFNWKFEAVVSETAGNRTHILYNNASGKYILWGGAGTEGPYSVFTALSPTSTFEFVGFAALDPTFTNIRHGDFTVFQQGDTAYMAWAALNPYDPREGSLWPVIYQTMHTSTLTSDWLNVSTVSYNVTSSAFDLVDQELESPDMFVRNGLFYVAASGTCGWCNGTIGTIYRSASIKGPWERDIVSGYSCGGQVEGVFTLTDPQTNETNYVWHSTTLPGGTRTAWSGHIFQPLNFNADGSVQPLDCSPEANFQVQFTLGEGVAATGLATSATDGTPRDAEYEPVCDSTSFFRLYQTWVNSKTGSLRSVSVNVAASGQTDNFTINVFKFSTLEELVAPGYKWTLLGTKTFDPSIGHTFSALTVPLNASVVQGDNLGFSIEETSVYGRIIGNHFTPWCHLEYSVESNDMVLFEQGSGKTSFAGLYGNISAVVQRPDRAIKFFANVV